MVNMILEDLIIKEIGLLFNLYGRLMDVCDEVVLKKKEFLLY